MGFTRLGTNFTQGFFNGFLDKLERQNIDTAGRLIMSGLIIADGGGLTINISGGWMLAVSPAQVAAQSGIVVPASSTRYVWISSTGSVTLTATAADIGGETVCLGRVVTDGSGVTSITHLGRYPSKGETHTEQHTLTGDLTLGSSCAPLQRIQCAAARKVLLPDSATCTLGKIIEIVNDNGGGGETITVRDSADANTIGILTAGNTGRFAPTFDASSWREI